MTVPEANTNLQGIEGRDCVPFFKSDKGQIKFEFIYLIALFIICSITLITFQFEWIPIEHKNKIFIFSIIGGLLGGWVYDTKWFYRVTARGKSNQYNFPWQCHKFYWRIFTPFLSSVVAFVTYNLFSLDMLPISIKNPRSASAAFSFCFVLGYFSDLVLSRLAAWAERLLPKSSKQGES